ncbi:MAG: hypothetical protein ABSG63_12965 [Spirochaetia bacterium]|jgi:hypothetical protein
MRGKQAGETEAQKEVLRELALLRARVDQVAEQYSLGVKAHIDEIMHQLVVPGTPAPGHVLPEPHSLAKLERKMKKLTEKPQTGRARDLKRIQDLVDALAAAMQGSA